MKTLILPVAAIAALAFAAPAFAAGCNYGTKAPTTTTEKPAEQPKSTTS
ncbi:MAG: hypothetical protein AAFV49_23255 [Pseudomonadota bacterium]